MHCNLTQHICETTRTQVLQATLPLSAIAYCCTCEYRNTVLVSGTRLCPYLCNPKTRYHVRYSPLLYLNRSRSDSVTPVLPQVLKKSVSAHQCLLILNTSGHYMYHQFNIQQFYVLPTQFIYVFCVDLRTNSDYFPIQHQLTGFITEI